jgi:hypothetical protein
MPPAACVSDLWQADHIVPVSEGGGLCGLVRAAPDLHAHARALTQQPVVLTLSLRCRAVRACTQENMRTLCVLCHDAVSTSLAGRNAARRRTRKELAGVGAGGGGGGADAEAGDADGGGDSLKEQERKLWEAEGDEDFAPARKLRKTAAGGMKKAAPKGKAGGGGKKKAKASDAPQAVLE